MSDVTYQLSHLYPDNCKSVEITLALERSREREPILYQRYLYTQHAAAVVKRRRRRVIQSWVRGLSEVVEKYILRRYDHADSANLEQG